VLLGQRHPNPEKATSRLDGAGKWTMPGGKLEFGESFIEGAKREVEEETGMRLKNIKVFCVNNDIGSSAHFVTIGLISEDPDEEPQVAEPDKISCWKWFEMDGLPEPMYFPSERIIKNFKEDVFFKEYK
jgi:8-oxo-dGTP diphosphatase